MKTNLRNLAIGVAALSLSGCAQVQAVIGANPQAAAVGAIGVEARTGIGCVDRTQAATTTGSPIQVGQRQVRIAYERIAFDATIAPLLSQTTNTGVGEARRLTDSLCPRLPVPPTPPVVVEPPASPSE